MAGVSHDLVQAWHRDGAVLIKGALDKDEMSIVRDAFEYRFAHLTPWTQDMTKVDDTRFFIDLLGPDMWDSPPYKRIWNETKLLGMAGEFFTAPDVWLLYEQIFFKQSSGTQAVQSTPWHQDLGYDPVEGRDLLRFWISLEPLEKSNALEFVRGSHLGPVYDPAAYNGNTIPLEGGRSKPPIPDIDADRSQWNIISWAMEPGDILAFHPGVIHGGAPTKPGCTRRTLTMLLFGRDSRYAPRMEALSADEAGTEGQAIQRILHEMFAKLRPGDPACLSTAPRLK